MDRHYPLREVAEALRYMEEGHAKGKVVITDGNIVVKPNNAFAPGRPLRFPKLVGGG